MHSLTPLEQLDLSRFDTLAILKKLGGVNTNSVMPSNA